MNTSHLLKKSTVLWFGITAIGQCAFVLYILLQFGGSAVLGLLEEWHRVAGGIVENDIVGNASVSSHLLLSAIITLSGLVQLVPHIRNKFLSFHRWNGRIYMLSAYVISVSGLYMIWGRNSDASGVMGQISASLNGVLIIVFSTLALKHALARRIPIHKEWAIRLFLTVSGVWFFRIGLMAWLYINDGPRWIDMDTFSGPFITFLNFGCYLLPLLGYETYLYVQKSRNNNARMIMSLFLLTFTVITAIGSYNAIIKMWLPRLDFLIS